MKLTPKFTQFCQLCLSLFAVTGQLVLGQTLGPNTDELKFSYTAEFVADRDVDQDSFIDSDDALANLHFNHMFGIFHSPTMVKRLGVPKKIEGVGAPRLPAKLTVLSSKSVGDRVRIRYRASGLLLLQKAAAKFALKGQALVLPLPNDLNAIYDKDCTDDHYDSFGDYWYFYDPFRKGCERLSRPPLATDVTLKITEGTSRALDEDFRLDLLKANNGNDDLLTISVVHGYADDARSRSDEGRLNFEALNDFLKREGFDVETQRINTNRPLYIFTKKVTLDNGKSVTIEIKHLLVETGAEAKGVTFAKFFREAAEQADVLVYAGHSGLGGNLDIATLEAKAGEFSFNSKKRQLLFFDSCASYSYYLDSFREEKTRAKIDVMTNGLSALFETGPAVLEAFLKPFISSQSDKIKWIDLMKDMERPLKGSSYLLNVGGI
jgi:hypothetical protein